MAENADNLPRRTLKYHQLRPGMTIQEITELSFSYATLDAETVRFLKANFKGASGVLIGDSGRETVPIAQVKELDQLEAIVDLPADLIIAKVALGLPESLYKRGFLEFKVTDSPDAPAAEEPEPEAPAIAVGSDEAKRAYQERLIQVKTFLETVNPALESRDRASNVIEEMMDRGRAGHFSSKGVESAIAEVTGQNLGSAMQAIAGLKNSDQTYAHCVDMAVILQGCYTDLLEQSGKKVDDLVGRLILVSGFMHDIGKSKLPKEIIDSTVAFAPDSKERIILRNHVTYGAQILSDMGMHKAAIDVAHYHHVKKDTSLLASYPDVPFDVVPSMVRFAAVVDVYQALIGRRSYKKNWVPGKAIDYILKRRNTEFDERMVDRFVASMGKYPVVSLVRLNTGDLAYVLMIAPKEHPERPVVSIIENAQGEMITHHEILDLMVEPDIYASEVVDHYEHYNETEDQAFRIFQSIEFS